jgi:hypothetical protein
MSETSSDVNIYADVAFSQSARILGLIDRKQDSRTFGCCFPYYWKYKLVDFNNLKLQEYILFLSLAYDIEHKNNLLYRSSYCIKICRGICEYWMARGNRNGSASELYPHENSLCATAFGTLAILMSLWLLRDDWPGLPTYLIKLERNVQWLSTHHSSDVANQHVASLASLIVFGQLSHSTQYDRAIEQKVDILRGQLFLQGQYFVEYGGFDYGYQTISLSILSMMRHYFQQEMFDDVLSSGVRFLDDVYDAEGHYVNHETSRRTQYTYPSSFVHGAPDLLQRSLRGIVKNRIITPLWLDDRYAPALAADYLLTYVYGRSAGLC